MMSTAKIINEVDKIYDDGAEGNLWELVMGRQIHIGGYYASMDLATKAGITPNMTGIDLCCNNGEGMRFLVRNRGVRRMYGVELTETACKRGRIRCQKEGFAKDQISFVQGDVTGGLPMFEDNTFDFVWGQDAWCYIPDKKALIATAARLIKPGGLLVFSDWIKGSNADYMSKEEYDRFRQVLTFPNLLCVDGYSSSMAESGCNVIVAEESNRFIPCTELYVKMLELQFKGDALRIYGNNSNAFDKVMKKMHFLLALARDNKIAQGIFVGQKKIMGKL
eukprot:UN02298